MNEPIQRTGDTGVQVSLDFPDGKSREDFEVAFRGWLKEYQQRATIQRSLQAAATSAAEEGDDTAGHLLRMTLRDRAGKVTDSYYVNLI